MNFRGGCCITRYGNEMSKVDRIMLRYRPIAPKPDSGGSSSPPSPKLDSVTSKPRRGSKRKLSKEKSSNSNGSVNSNGNSKRCDKNGSNEKVTLSLLPETPERKENSPPARVLSPLSYGDNGRYKKTDLVTESVVTVECVEEGGGFELGCTDYERKINLERDTCPGFISDGLGRVVWTNESYRELVKASREMSVWLVMKEKPLVTQRSFTCRVRLQYTCRSVTAPCDVWKMDDGGFAWRLDVKAALCLGR